MALARWRISSAQPKLPSRAWIEMAIETLVDLLDVIDGDCDLEAEPIEDDGDGAGSDYASTLGSLDDVNRRYRNVARRT